MKLSFTYADLQVTAIVQFKKDHEFNKLSDNEVNALQQILYMSLNTFHFTRGLYLAGQIDYEELDKEAQIDRISGTQGG